MTNESLATVFGNSIWQRYYVYTYDCLLFESLREKFTCAEGCALQRFRTSLKQGDQKGSLYSSLMGIKYYICVCMCVLSFPNQRVCSSPVCLHYRVRRNLFDYCTCVHVQGVALGSNHLLIRQLLHHYEELCRNNLDDHSCGYKIVSLFDQCKTFHKVYRRHGR